jgi:hypothetical protein
MFLISNDKLNRVGRQGRDAKAPKRGHHVGSNLRLFCAVRSLPLQLGLVNVRNTVFQGVRGVEDKCLPLECAGKTCPVRTERATTAPFGVGKWVPALPRAPQSGVALRLPPHSTRLSAALKTSMPGPAQSGVSRRAPGYGYKTTRKATICTLVAPHAGEIMSIQFSWNAPKAK